MPRQLAARLLAHMSFRGPHVSTVDHPSVEGLTPRERDVHRLLAEGLGDRDIAAALTISRRTVETHVSNILHKLGAQNRTEVAARYHDES
jgi:DNA-binding NarL/FixJ family response regulator